MTNKGTTRSGQVMNHQHVCFLELELLTDGRKKKSKWSLFLYIGLRFSQSSNKDTGRIMIKVEALCFLQGRKSETSGVPTSSVLHSYFTVLHRYFTRTSRYFSCTSPVLHSYFTCTSRYFIVLQSYFNCTSWCFTCTSF